MVIPLRAGLAAGFAAALAFATSQARLHASAPPASSGSLLSADLPADGPSPAYGGCAALAVGGFGLLTRLRRR